MPEALHDLGGWARRLNVGHRHLVGRHRLELHDLPFHQVRNDRRHELGYLGIPQACEGNRCTAQQKVAAKNAELVAER